MKREMLPTKIGEWLDVLRGKVGNLALVLLKKLKIPKSVGTGKRVMKSTHRKERRAGGA